MQLKIDTVPTMNAIFVVNCWVNTKPLNRTQPTNLQLCSNQLTNQPQVLVWGERGKNTFAPSSHIYRLVSGWNTQDFGLILSKNQFCWQELKKNYVSMIFCRINVSIRKKSRKKWTNVDVILSCNENGIYHVSKSEEF